MGRERKGGECLMQGEGSVTSALCAAGGQVPCSGTVLLSCATPNLPDAPTPEPGPTQGACHGSAGGSAGHVYKAPRELRFAAKTENHCS